MYGICNQHSSIKNLQIGDGEAAQLVKGLPCKNKDLSLTLSMQIKSWVWWHTLGEAKTEGTLGLTVLPT